MLFLVADPLKAHRSHDADARACDGVGGGGGDVAGEPLLWLPQ